jgi:hypothetical protein
MPDDADATTPSELAARISDADRPSKQGEPQMRFIWNVPPGVKPHVSFGFAMLVLGCLLMIPIFSFLTR